MSFSKKRKEPGCCPHTPHPTHPPPHSPVQLPEMQWKDVFAALKEDTHTNRKG